jgi:hypothetical protein
VLTATRCKSDLRRLSPMTGDPNPASASAYPMSRDPNSHGTGRSDPRARHPNITCAVPAPITRRPSVTWTRRNGLRFDANRRGGLRHDDIARNRLGRGRDCRAGSSDFACDRSCCGHRGRLIGASNQSKWQRQHPNAYSHSIPFCIRFVSN